MSETNQADVQPSTTAAKRLHQLLVEVRKGRGANFFEILPVVLNTTSSDLVVNSKPAWDAIRAQRLIANMIDDFQRELNEAQFNDDGDRQFYARCLPGILEALSPVNMATPISNAKLKITDVELNNLESADRVLREHVAEKQMKSEDFSDLLSAVEDARTSVQGSALPEKLKAFILARLVQIKIAIEEYRYRGINGVEEALVAYRGTLGSVWEFIEKESDDGTKITLKRVIEVGQVVVSVAKIVHSAWPYVRNGFHAVAGFLSS